MKRLLSNLAFIVVGNLSAGDQFGITVIGTASGAPAAETKYLFAHQEADPRFLTSIERIGPCKVSGPPVTGGIKIPWQLYPEVSVANHEEGSVVIELVLDPDWCVRKATIAQSTQYWRLDKVSLEFVMTVKYKPDPKLIKLKDGESTVVVKMAWGASQGKR
jgi:TonB family protein